MTSVRLFGLVALTMVAFAANSILNRLALTDAAMGPASFAFVRLLSGAGCLSLMVVLRRAGWPRVSWPQAAALVVYALGFSFAYVALDAGFGALLLFGGVQVTMFAGAFVLRESLPTQRLTGGLIAFLGLVWLLWPNGASAPPLMPSVLMLTAAVAWGVYSLIGRGATDPLGDTAWAFVLATPVALGVAVTWPDPVSLYGLALAVIAGAVTSGLGYALWYTVLPELGASRAAVAQLSVPLIAVAVGVVLLGEAIALRMGVSALLVIAGVSISLVKR